jgi:hypothetical protein
VLVGRIDARTARSLAGHEAGEQAAHHRGVIRCRRTGETARILAPVT